MIRLLSIAAAIATLAFSAAPVASAVPAKKPPPRTTGTFHEYGHLTHYLMVNASGGWDPTLRTVQARGSHVIASVGVKYTM